MVLLQLMIGITAALFIWGFIRMSFHSLLWVIGITLIVSLLIPGAFAFIGGILLIFIGMLAALGVLFIMGAFKN
ncbi:hypothetical protein [Paenibacillus sp. 1_12]|uniref:hypothetical protein n=1 Tax=Paenibacillus sp. 1_12 TaxID=1566278 RepID=UPI000B82E76B|nr:hypothetical protein [Paenibacillus sp. 1_12]